MQKIMTRWYAMHTKPRAERRLAATMRERGFEVYLPEITNRVDSTPVREPLFPGYLFAQIDMENADSNKWRWTPGLRYVVAYGDVPIAIPNEVLTLISHKVGEFNAGSNASGHSFLPGDLVRVKKGPFADVLAIFDGPPAPSERVLILMDALNRTIRLRVDAVNLEKVTASAKTLPERRTSRRTRGRGRKVI